MKFTKKHNSVARKKLFKVRQAKLAGGQAQENKAVKRDQVRQTEQKKSSWSLGSLLKNITSYFTGETTAQPVRKRTKRTHPKKKSGKTATAAAPASAKATTTTGKK